MTATEQRFETAPESFGPGAYLRAAREAAGWSVEQAAQQLKLAPRQVKALEDEDFAQLPGRTFARGFVRNYARLLNLDAEGLLALLPDATQAPGLGAPALHSTSTRMGELPSSESSKPNFARWLIPFVLVGCIVAAAGYEWYRGGLSTPSEPAPAAEGTRELGTAAPRPGVAAPQPATNVAPQSSGTPLPNPLAMEAKPADASPSPVSPELSRPSGASEHVATNTPAVPAGIAQPAERSSAPSAAAAASAPRPAAAAAVPETAPASSATLAASANAPLVLTYRGPSWTEVKDRSGQVLIARLVAPNSVQPINGTPPFHIVLGNARAVSMAYRGKSVDLTRYTRQNVARLTLR